VQGTDYDTSWRADTGGGGTVTTYDVDPITGERKQAATGTTTYGPGSDLLLTADDIAAQIQKEKDAAYADALNVHNIEQERHNIELGDYVNQINAADAAANTTAAADADAQNVYNIQSANVAAQNAENAANYQNQLNDYYAANPNSPRYPDDYGQGITSVIPDVAPNVFPVTGGGTDYGSGGNYDYGDVYGGGGGGGVGGGKASDYDDQKVQVMAHGGIASLPKSPGQRLLAAHRAGDMATVHRMLKKVRR
jgi:hypothetical protein